MIRILSLRFFVYVVCSYVWLDITHTHTHTHTEFDLQKGVRFWSPSYSLGQVAFYAVLPWLNPSCSKANPHKYLLSL